MAHDFPSMFRGLSLDELEKTSNWSATTRSRLLDLLTSLRNEVDGLRQDRGLPTGANDIRASLEHLISGTQSALGELDAKREVLRRERDRLKAALAALDGATDSQKDGAHASAPLPDVEQEAGKKVPAAKSGRRRARGPTGGRVTARQAVRCALEQVAGPLSRKQIIAGIDSVTPHAVDVALSTMVRQGELVRVKPGHYELAVASEAA